MSTETLPLHTYRSSVAYVTGRIYTIDDKDPWASAFIVGGDRNACRQRREHSIDRQRAQCHHSRLDQAIRNVWHPRCTYASSVKRAGLDIRSGHQHGHDTSRCCFESQTRQLRVRIHQCVSRMDPHNNIQQSELSRLCRRSQTS